MNNDCTILIANLIQIIICGYTPGSSDVTVKAPTERARNHPIATPKILNRFYPRVHLLAVL